MTMDWYLPVDGYVLLDRPRCGTCAYYTWDKHRCGMRKATKRGPNYNPCAYYKR